MNFELCSDLPNNFKEYLFQSSQHTDKYVVQLSPVSQIAPLSPYYLLASPTLEYHYSTLLLDSV